MESIGIELLPYLMDVLIIEVIIMFGKILYDDFKDSEK